MINKFSTILLDMNDTFMFGADRFGKHEDYSTIYHQLGGSIESSRVNYLVQAAYDYLTVRYPDPQYREMFPSLRSAFKCIETQYVASHLITNLWCQRKHEHRCQTLNLCDV